MLRQIDIPPLWLGLSLALAWLLSRLFSWPWPVLGMAMMATALALMAVALAQMLLARTTFIPRRNPQALVSGGVFAISRNPIYLADAIFLTGAILYWGAVLAWPVVPLFMLLITHRYIKDEEARLRAGFGAEFVSWAEQVPRWIWRI